MTNHSRRMAGIILITVPTVVFGGTSLLRMLTGDATYAANPLRQDLWRAGHAHAGVLLLFALVALRYVDETRLSEPLKWFVRVSFPAAAIFLPLAFFLSVLTPQATAPNELIRLAYVGALLVALGALTLGIGLIRVHSEGKQNEKGH